MAPKRVFGTSSVANQNQNAHGHLSRQQDVLKPLQAANATGQLKRAVNEVSPSSKISSLFQNYKKIKPVETTDDNSNVDAENRVPDTCVSSLIGKHEAASHHSRTFSKAKTESTNTIETKIKAINFTEDGKTNKKKLFADESTSCDVGAAIGIVAVPTEPEVGITAHIHSREYIRDGIDFADPYTYYQITSKPENITENVLDFDGSQLSDMYAEPHYAWEIFQYYKIKEEKVKIKNYMDHQPDISKQMRSVLVDWMVEVQESFELNHETLYLAVKMVDYYAMKEKIHKREFQLIGAVCLLIASKFDERIPPAIEDFQYICDDAYTRDQIIHMEMKVLKILDFELTFPISYRFLRRYARIAKLPMDVLTLARYALEVSLTDYDLIEEKDSRLGAAALLLALKMKKLPGWDETLSFYSGYSEEEILPMVHKLNDLISAQPRSELKTIHTKYSHKVFWEVAKISPLPKQ